MSTTETTREEEANTTWYTSDQEADWSKLTTTKHTILEYPNQGMTSLRNTDRKKNIVRTPGGTCIPEGEKDSTLSSRNQTHSLISTLQQVNMRSLIFMIFAACKSQGAHRTVLFHSLGCWGLMSAFTHEECKTASQMKLNNDKGKCNNLYHRDAPFLHHEQTFQQQALEIACR